MRGKEGPALPVIAFPSPRAYATAVVANVAGNGAWATFVSFRMSESQRPWLVVATAVICIVIAALHFRNTRIMVTDDAVVHVNWLGLRRRVARKDVALVLLVSRLTEADQDSPAMYLLRTDGQRLMKIAGPSWVASELDEVLEALDAPYRKVKGAVDLRELRREHPRAESWARANAITITIVATIVAVGVVLALSLTAR